MNIAIATSETYPNLPEDEQCFVRALREEGASVEPIVWTDSTVNLAAFDACIVRSTWDFHHKLPAFLTWIDRVERESACINNAAAIRWNSEKNYLLDLSSRGVPIVPTEIVRRDQPVSARARAARNGWSDYVIKPTVSASSFLTERFRCGGAADPDLHLETILAHSDALVQPFMHDVEHSGERSYVVIDGTITHAVRRAPFNGGARGIAQPRVSERRKDTELVRAAWAALPETPLYARIDVVRDAHGEPVLSECELIEPSLFFALHANAAARLARAVRREIGDRR